MLGVLKTNLKKLWLILLGLPVLAVLVYQIPAVSSRLSWRAEIAQTYLRNALNPAGELPTSLPQPAVAVTLHPTQTPTADPSAAPTATPTQGPTATPTLTPTPLPETVSLPAPQWEKQTANNCGPASLALYLSTFGWEGNQEDISQLLKPHTDDRNVNVEELIYFVRNRAGWLNAEFRVGGDIERLKAFLAAGIPVLIEEGFILEETYWPDDDHWAGHYLLLTGYDDTTKAFIAQDTFLGADRVVPYTAVEDHWQAFNYVYIMLFRPEQAATVQAILGEDWDADANRQNALELSQEQTKADPLNAFSWFNLGSNLVYFERYAEAARAYDQARQLGLPQRMLRYQFGPFFAYFFSSRNADLLSLTEYAMKITPNSEETLLWRGWGYYRDGKKSDAIADFNQALQENPNYQDAQYALDFIANNP
jgi:tetratricopeptide (TPR) repeat protein